MNIHKLSLREFRDYKPDKPDLALWRDSRGFELQVMICKTRQQLARIVRKQNERPRSSYDWYPFVPLKDEEGYR